MAFGTFAAGSGHAHNIVIFKNKSSGVGSNPTYQCTFFETTNLRPSRFQDSGVTKRIPSN